MYWSEQGFVRLLSLAVRAPSRPRNNRRASLSPLRELKGIEKRSYRASTSPDYSLDTGDVSIELSGHLASVSAEAKKTGVRKPSLSPQLSKRRPTMLALDSLELW